MTAVVVPGPLADRLEPLLGCRLRTAEATVGGHSNLVFICALSDGRRVVVKAATSSAKRADVEREAAVLGVLADESLPVARMVAASHDDEWAVVVTEHLEGRDGLSVVPDMSLDPDLAARTGALMGETLRAIHTTAPRPLPGDAFDRGAQATAAMDAIRASGAPADIIESSVVALGDPLHRRGLAFMHGDPGLHNIVWCAAQPGRPLALRAVVDWELAGWGNPMVDVAWVWWTLWFRGLPPQTGQAFADGYGRWAIEAMGWSGDTVDAAVRSQMAALLARTEPGTEVRKLWVERIRGLGALPDIRSTGG